MVKLNTKEKRSWAEHTAHASFYRYTTPLNLPRKIKNNTISGI